MQTQINEVINSALYSSRKLRITFKQGAVDQVMYLLLMAHSGMILLDDGDKETMTSVYNLGGWRNHDDRTLTVNLTEFFIQSYFVTLMKPGLESVETINH